MIYLDYHATTPVDPRVADRIYHYMVHEFGNASSIDHEYGDIAEAAVKQSAQHVAELIGASPREIVFTSGATESINLAIQGTVANLEKVSIKPRIALSTVEHKAVLDTCYAMQKQNRLEVIQIPVDRQAQIDLEHLEKTCATGIHLLCVMAANNEVGTIYPIEKISQIAQAHAVPCLCDASQAVGKIPIQFNDWGISLLAISAHKFYGPKGIGALVVRKGYPLEPILFGGGHQRGLRSGTLNVPGIVGLGDACRLRQLEMEVDEKAIAEKRDRLQSLLLEGIPGLIINGDQNNRLAGNLHISIPGVPNSAVIARVRHQLAISTGSACSSGIETPSHVLNAMDLSESVVEGSLRIGVGRFTKGQEIEQAASLITVAAAKILQLVS
jgi:cysteine desulfurase